MSKIDALFITFIVLVFTCAIVLTIINHENEGALDEQCIRQGYVESMELWGIEWCVRMEEGRLIGVQVE